MTPDQYAYRTFRRINDVREHHGLHLLWHDVRAEVVAMEWALHCDRTDTFEHRNQGVVLERCQAIAAGEVMGRGYEYPKALVKAWMSSPIHRVVLLNPAYRRVGVGSVRTDQGEWLVVANLIAR